MFLFTHLSRIINKKKLIYDLWTKNGRQRDSLINRWRWWWKMRFHLICSLRILLHQDVTRKKKPSAICIYVHLVCRVYHTQGTRLKYKVDDFLAMVLLYTYIHTNAVLVQYFSVYTAIRCYLYEKERIKKILIKTKLHVQCVTVKLGWQKYFNKIILSRRIGRYHKVAKKNVKFCIHSTFPNKFQTLLIIFLSRFCTMRADFNFFFLC